MESYEFKNLRCGIYCRKSEESEDKQVLSIPSQKEQGLKLAANFGVTNAVFYEEAKSAKLAGRRIVFKKLISDLKTGKIDAIICWKLDRLARNMKEGGEVMDLLQRNVIKIILTPAKNYVPDENALLMAFEFGYANQYSRDLSVNVKRGHSKKASMGYPHGLAALGFLNDKTGDKGNRTWKVDAQRFSIIKELFQIFLTGSVSVGKLSIEARNTYKLATPKRRKIGGALLTRANLYRLLKNPIYAGFFYLGGERYELHKSLPRIINENEYRLIQAMISNRSMPKMEKHTGVYTGFIKSQFNEFIGQDVKFQLVCDCKFKFAYRNTLNCPKCQRSIENMQLPKYFSYTYYYNVKRRKSHLLSKSITESKITQFLTSYVKENLTLSPALSEWSKKYIDELDNRVKENAKTIVQSQKDFNQSIQEKKSKLRNLLLEGFITPDEYKEDIVQLQNQQVDLNQNSDPNSIQQKLHHITDLTEVLLVTLQSNDVNAKRNILSKYGSNLIWDEEKLDIINQKPLQILIDGLSLAKSKNSEFEPNNIVDTSDKNSVFKDVCPTMRATWDNVRIEIEKEIKDINRDNHLAP